MTDRRLRLLARAASAITQCTELLGDTWTELILGRIEEVRQDITNSQRP